MNVPTVTEGLKTLSALSFLIEITINHLFYVEVTTELKHETSGTAHIATITALSSPSQELAGVITAICYRGDGHGVKDYQQVNL